MMEGGLDGAHFYGFRGSAGGRGLNGKRCRLRGGRGLHRTAGHRANVGFDA